MRSLPRKRRQNERGTHHDYRQQRNPAGNPKRKRWLLILLAVIVLATLASVAWEFFYGRWHEDTDDAYINGNVVQITPQIVGTVVSIGADDGDLVRKGQELVRFDPSDADIALQRAEANLAHTVRQVRGLFSNVDGYRAEVATRKVALAKAEADYKRRKNLADDGAISQEELAHARDALDSAKASLTSSEQQLNTNRALVDDTQITSHPDVKAAAAQLRQAYLDDARSTIVAPVTGYVAKRSVQVGQRVQPGTALMAVVPLDQIWIDANFKETQLKHMRIGQPVEIRSDLYGSDVRYSGTVDSLGVGTGSAFSLLPAQNATGNWIKIVQRVPVRIHIDPQELQKHPLRIGLSMDVKVDLHDQSGPALAQQPPREALFSTDVYQQQLASADKLIERLIEANLAEDHGKTAQR
ncbi:HlyD family efflux transporter periplasmic adaptor subunit [Pseudomonas aeruginosa]|nr:HlyD family efflux transporter periplasmic adaptor subunit [Pseudomonas aeruginosa]